MRDFGGHCGLWTRIVIISQYFSSQACARRFKVIDVQSSLEPIRTRAQVIEAFNAMKAAKNCQLPKGESSIRPAGHV